MIFSFKTSGREIKKVKASNEDDEFLEVAIYSLAFSCRHFQAVFKALF